MKSIGEPIGVVNENRDMKTWAQDEGMGARLPGVGTAGAFRNPEGF